MTDLKQELERIAQERLVAERESERIRFWDFIRSGLLCVAFAAIGLVFFFFAFWVNDILIGRALLYGGMVVGYSGMAWVLLSLYKRGAERGDW
jgi:hypothetical protein